jgi:hypothetical protein
VARRPHLLLVVGVGRSGTSAFTGSVAALGYAVPQPEVRTDPTNPRGFSEPRWVVDFHKALLRARGVDNFDSRPYAWQLSARAARSEENRELLAEWLAGELAQHRRVVVKDPRTMWLLGLWRRVSEDVGADVSVVTMLRPPAEVVASARHWYAGDHFETSRLAGWINVQLRTEKMTRDIKRTFVHYERLLGDGVKVLNEVDRALDLGLDLDDQEGLARVNSFLDPGLRRARDSIEQLEATPAVLSIADRVWAALVAIADRDTPTARSTLDKLRAEYRRLYLDAEQLVRRSVMVGMTETEALRRRKTQQAPSTDEPADAHSA